MSSLLFSQEVNAVLSGTVLDSGGGLVAGANVTISNTRTGVRIPATSNSAGIYLSPPLEPGVYQITAEHPGFKRHVLDGLTLNVGDRLNINLQLELGAVTESVEVKADSGIALGYASASVGKAIDGPAIQQLPLTERNILTLVGTQAGVQGPNIGGQTRVGLNISMDGVSILDNRTNFGLVTPLFTSVDRVGEVQVITSPADAEIGRGGGHIVIISRSGTNQFHGSVFEQLRNTDLNANSFFNNFQGTPRNILVRNQFGAGVDGPIVKNKIFFRFHIESQRLASQNAVTQTVYTAQARQGLFRYFPGAQNANSASLRPTVTPQGNPVQPANATGPLQTVSVYNLDPNRGQPILRDWLSRLSR